MNQTNTAQQKMRNQKAAQYDEQHNIALRWQNDKKTRKKNLMYVQLTLKEREKRKM